jgi:predicted MFS family arabinose efflux permease
MGDSGNPHRAFGIKLGLESMPSIILLFALPVLVIPEYGFKGMAYAMAATCFVIGILSGLLPSRGVKNDTAVLLPPAEGEMASAGSTASPAALTLSFLTLAAGIMFFSGILATWAFLEIMGTGKGLPADEVGVVLALGLMSSAVGAFVAGWLGSKAGRNLPLIAIVIVNVASLIIIWLSTSLVSFAAGTILFTFCVNYGLAYFFGLSAEVDLSGRFVVLCATTISLGGVIGPALGGRLMESQGFETVLACSAVFSILSLAIYMTVVRLTR